MFEPNTKVVCINDRFPPKVVSMYPKLPVKGEIYTVRDIAPGDQYGKGETVAVYLHEIKGPINQIGIEHGFSYHRFQELEDVTDTIEKKEEAYA